MKSRKTQATYKSMADVKCKFIWQIVLVRFFLLDRKCIYTCMLQSCVHVGIEYYSVAYFDHTTAFKALYMNIR